MVGKFFFKKFPCLSRKQLKIFRLPRIFSNMPFDARYAVRSSEIGEDYRLKESGAALLFQECAAEYFASRGLAGYDMTRRGLTWLMGEIEARFSAPMPFWRESVAVRVWIRGGSAARMYADFEMAGEDGRAFARGEASYIAAEVDGRRPLKISEFLSAFETDPRRALDGFGGVFDICGKISADPFPAVCRKVRADDIDFNSHLTNAKYLPRAVEALPDEFLASRRLAGYAVKFRREARLGESVDSVARASGNCALHGLSVGGLPAASVATIWEAR